MSQIKKKKQIKTSGKELNKMETCYLKDAEFKTLFMRRLNELRGREDEFSKNFNKEIGNIKTELDLSYFCSPVRMFSPRTKGSWVQF